MSHLKGSITEKNLLKSFSGESQARNRYTFFAAQAKKEGYEQIADIFLETANNEMEHAKKFFKFMEGGAVEITATYPFGIIGTTAENLKASAGGEHEEWTSLYPAFAQTAETEGFKEVADAYRLIAKIEAEHEKRYLKLLENVEKHTVFKKDKPIKWKCRNCGHIHEGDSAPEKCPTCQHAKAYFEVKGENY